MPEQTYNIGYNSNDFFYKTGTENTLPFNIPNLKLWINSITSNTVTTDTIDLFDNNVTNVVFKNKDKFINDYLQGNIILSGSFSDFKPITMDQTTIAKNSSYTDITNNLQIGSITLNSESSDPITFELNKESTIEYRTNSLGLLGNDISLNADITGNANVEINEPDDTSGPSFLTATTLNPRCKYKKNCTTHHWHYKDCKTQIIRNENGSSYCKCVCSGPKTNDATPHSHCSPYNIGVDGTSKEGEPNNVHFRNLLSGIKNIVVSMTKQSDTVTGTSNSGFSSTEYTYSDDAFNNNDKNIRTLLYEYYEKLNENKAISNKIIAHNSQNNTNNQALLDANVKYKKEYLHLFNIFSGICFASGYIYVMYKTQAK